MVFYRTRLLKWSELPIHNKNVIGQLGVPKSLDSQRTKRELQILLTITLKELPVDSIALRLIFWFTFLLGDGVFDCGALFVVFCVVHSLAFFLVSCLIRGLTFLLINCVVHCFTFLLIHCLILRLALLLETWLYVGTIPAYVSLFTS